MKLDGRLLHQAQVARVDLALTVGAGLMGGIVIVAQALLLSRIVSRVFLATASLNEVREPLLVLLLLSLGQAGLAWGGEVAAGRVAVRVKAGLRQQLAAHLLALGPDYARGERSGELANTIVEGIEALDAYFRQYLPQLALAALVPLTVLAVVLPLDWISGLVLLLTAPLIPVFMVLIGHAADALTRRQWTVLSRMSAHFLDVLQGLTTLKLLGRSREQVRTIAHVGDRYRMATMGVLRVAFLSALVLEMVATISTAVVAVQIGLRLLYGHLSFEQGFFVLLLAPEFYLPLRLLGARFHAGMAGTAAAQRIFAILETAPDRAGAAETGEKNVPPLPLGISFSDVQYAYETGRRAALQDFSLRVAPGETVALVGPSGAGKSTVAHLLLRFAAPDRGTIAVNGQPLGELSPAAWRAQVAWVPQHPYLFHDTVLNNVRLARPDASREQVIHAARLAHAHDFVVALPQGYDTVVGERGARLSGGQAQRIALARAFLQDAPLLVLDEATANLDPEVEDLVQEAMARLLPGRTALVIAHRLGTVTRADRIVVLDGGRVVETGRHIDLVQQEGLYQQLVGAYAGDSAPQPIDRETGPREGTPSPGPATTATARAQREPQWPAPAPPAETGSPWHTCKRLLELATPFAPRMVLATVLGLATIGSGIGLMTTSGYLIARAALQPSIAALQVAIVGVRFFGIARGVFRYLERYVSHDTTFRLLAHLRVWFYGVLEPLAPARLMQYRSGDLLARIVADIETLETIYLRGLAPPLVAVLVALLAGVLLGRFDPRLAAVQLAFMLLAGAGLPLLTRSLGRTPGRRLVQVRATLNATLVDGIQGVADLLAFGGQAEHLARVRALSRELGTLQKRMANISGLHGALTGLLMNLATLSVLAAAIPLVTGSALPGVYLAALVLAAISSFEAVLPLPQAFQDLEASLAAAARLFEIVDTTPAVRDPPVPLPAPSAFDLRVEDVRFAYGAPALGAAAPSAGTLDVTFALDGVSLDLPPGAQVAVVGPSGAGKSTLAHLLLRFWDYQGGRILLDGRELRHYTQADVRRGIAVVSQHTHLFNGTVRENLLLARPAATEAKLVEATRQAQLHEFVVSLPQGYDTWIGEGGQRLSGGQRQRLAIARALLQDAPLLLLDEPAAHLDALTERALLAALQVVMAGRTTLTITHRLAGLEAADEILVLRAGRVIERGRHDDLLRRGGLYRRMWELQHQVLVSKCARPDP